MLAFTKAHAYGNDFLYVRRDALAPGAPIALDVLAREICDRHTGVGADGLIVYHEASDAAMQLFNADGSRAEVSGNGVRGLAAILLRDQAGRPADSHRQPRVTIHTDGGVKTLTRTGGSDGRQTFRAHMGLPEDLHRTSIEVWGEALDLVIMNLGNPQSVVLGPLPDAARFHRLGPAIETHAIFREGTNVEFADVEGPGRVQILIWERGVGPTLSSGTGSCAAAIAAAAYGGAARDVEVVAPGGAQRVEWRDDGVYITGWAEIVADGTWLRDLPRLGG